MRILVRVDENGEEKQVFACPDHSVMILERWKMTHTRNAIHMEELPEGAYAECVICPKKMVV